MRVSIDGEHSPTALAQNPITGPRTTDTLAPIFSIGNCLVRSSGAKATAMKDFESMIRLV